MRGMKIVRAVRFAVAVGIAVVGLASRADAGIVLPVIGHGSPDVTVTGLTFEIASSVLTITDVRDIFMGTDVGSKSGWSSTPSNHWVPGGTAVPADSKLIVTLPTDGVTDGTFSMFDGVNTTTATVTDFYFLGGSDLQLKLGNIDNQLQNLSFGNEAVFWASAIPAGLKTAFESQGSFAAANGGVSDTFAVPEPGVLALLALGLGAIGRRRFGRRR